MVVSQGYQNRGANMSIIETIGALIAAALAAWAFGRRQGSQRAKQDMAEKDNANADKIRDAADRARRADDAGNVDAIERLQRRGRLRD